MSQNLSMAEVEGTSGGQLMQLLYSRKSNQSHLPRPMSRQLLKISQSLLATFVSVQALYIKK